MPSPPCSNRNLADFHPLVSGWFAARYGGRAPRARGAFYAERFATDETTIEAALTRLETQGQVLRGRFSGAGAAEEFCNRRVLSRESLAPPWRELLAVLRRMEARGEIRGGRFVAVFVGEQFALSEAIEALRAARRCGEEALPQVSMYDPPAGSFNAASEGAEEKPMNS